MSHRNCGRSKGAEIFDLCATLSKAEAERDALRLEKVDLTAEITRLRDQLADYEVLLFDIQTALDEYDWTDFPAHVREDVLARIREVLSKGEGDGE